MDIGHVNNKYNIFYYKIKQNLIFGFLLCIYNVQINNKYFTELTRISKSILINVGIYIIHIISIISDVPTTISILQTLFEIDIIDIILDFFFYFT